MTKIICLNGPPNCGKDTVGNMIKTKLAYQGYECETIAVKDALFHYIKENYPFVPLEKYHASTIEVMGAEGSRGLPKRFKEAPVIDFMGQKMSMRQLLIDLSEEQLKPKFGSDFLAKMCYDAVFALDVDFAIITDVGFNCEYTVFRDNLETHLIKIYRYGCNFEKDSRKRLAACGDKVYRLNNDSTLAELAKKLDNLIEEII
ncbi:MAG: hypothetical protein CME61_09495 [Halobacteriovoraceae bacterium]|nr:hypothetical protein [Halobacteriovoraceae bacterium]|tara:strand:+ start:1271 stop:1876 length:606 start_codon:yes stop_codon:yes gene_type:complete